MSYGSASAPPYNPQARMSRACAAQMQPRKIKRFVVSTFWRRNSPPRLWRFLLLRIFRRVRNSVRPSCAQLSVWSYSLYLREEPLLRKHHPERCVLYPYAASHPYRKAQLRRRQIPMLRKLKFWRYRHFKVCSASTVAFLTATIFIRHKILGKVFFIRIKP